MRSAEVTCQILGYVGGLFVCPEGHMKVVGSDSRLFFISSEICNYAVRTKNKNEFNWQFYFLFAMFKRNFNNGDVFLDYINVYWINDLPY